MEHLSAAMRSCETIEGLTEAKRKSIRHSLFRQPKYPPAAADDSELHFLQMQIEQFERVHGGKVHVDHSSLRPKRASFMPRQSQVITEEDWKATHNRIHKTSSNPLLRFLYRVRYHKSRSRKGHVHAEWSDERRDEYLRPVDLSYW